MAFAFDCAEVCESLPNQAASLFEKMCIFRSEIARALVQNLDNAFGAVSAGERRKHSGLYADATGLFEMFEVFQRQVTCGEAACGSRFEYDRQRAFADGIRHGNDALARFSPAGTANEAFGSRIVDPHEDGARAESGAHAS